MDPTESHQGTSLNLKPGCFYGLNFGGGSSTATEAIYLRILVICALDAIPSQQVYLFSVSRPLEADADFSSKIMSRRK
jgi:hypothetical protein